MASILQQTSFRLSAYQVSDLPLDSGFEVCFMGRSNVGKSSLINALCERRQLARVSKTPGRTQCLNVFDIQSHARLVDCPGYGFAKVDKGMRSHWRTLMQKYLQKRKSLVRIYWMMDARHPLQPADQEMLSLLSDYYGKVVIVLSKLDALNKDQQKRIVLTVASEFKKAHTVPRVLGVSSLKKIGMDILIQDMSDALVLRAE